MSRILNITGTDYNYPDNGENPGWGEDATEWASAVTNAVNDILNANDITTTTFSIADNVVTPTDILGFRFNPSAVRSFTAEYNVSRTDGVTTFVETGFITAIYNNLTWVFSRQYVGDAGLTMSITNAGQVQYTSSNIGGVYTGEMKFKARTILQV